MIMIIYYPQHVATTQHNYEGSKVSSYLAQYSILTLYSPADPSNRTLSASQGFNYICCLSLFPCTCAAISTSYKSIPAGILCSCKTIRHLQDHWPKCI